MPSPEGLSVAFAERLERAIPQHLQDALNHEVSRIAVIEPGLHRMPTYNPTTYHRDLGRSLYFDALVVLRHFIQAMSHHYFGVEQNAKQVDLFMMTPTVSSPMGPGSDSEPIRISFGGLDTYLVDSSQFGFEPLLFNGLEKVYCYLPSMRGEDPDHRHLNQFYHCEAEILGKLDDMMLVVEGYVRRLAHMTLAASAITERLSDDVAATTHALEQLANSNALPRITFDEAVTLLMTMPDAASYVRITPHGRDITSHGELELLRQLGHGVLPVWITHFDRDRVPFYQKPSAHDANKVENADLLFPSLREGSFGGEIVGAGQRQDSADEILESLARQNGISAEPYEWYIDLRRHPGYRTTSGFGLGVERFIAWALAKPSIRDVSLYPRLKGVQTYP
ncbi:MAG: hypothetical protein NUV56_01300 [Candidatus Uhrbacteria bacterium]|nr:hypothetical protein [Candidatus Uhrbacteria bacterium]